MFVMSSNLALFDNWYRGVWPAHWPLPSYIHNANWHRHTLVERRSVLSRVIAVNSTHHKGQTSAVDSLFEQSKKPTAI